MEYAIRYKYFTRSAFLISLFGPMDNNASSIRFENVLHRSCSSLISSNENSVRNNILVHVNAVNIWKRMCFFFNIKYLLPYLWGRTFLMAMMSFCTSLIYSAANPSSLLPHNLFHTSELMFLPSPNS